jgi:C1A family cysteine protease
MKKSPVSGQKPFGDGSAEWLDAIGEAQFWRNKYHDIDEIPNEYIPQRFDLRNIKGFDFTGPLRDQSECGSCFTMAYVQAIEGRLRLKYAHLGEKAAKQVSP